MIETKDLFRLHQILKSHAPVDTGTLKNEGIAFAIQQSQNKYIVNVGLNISSNSGRNPSKYVWFTEYSNKSSSGWIERAIYEWANEMIQKYMNERSE